MTNVFSLFIRTNHLDESIALLEELSIAASPKNTRLRSQISAAATNSDSKVTPPSTSSAEESLSFLSPIKEETVLPIYPKLKDFPVVYTKTWELENAGARKIMLRLCEGKIDSMSLSSSRSEGRGDSKDGEKEEQVVDTSRLDDKRKARYQKSLRNTSIKWKGEHPQEKGFYVGSRRLKELSRNVSKRGQDSF